MSQNQKCPQCGENLTFTPDQKIHCLMCGWGGDGVPIPVHTGKSAFFLNKSRRWKIIAISATLVGMLVLPTLIMYPINQARADAAIKEARSLMDQRLYASAARVLHGAPQTLVSSSKSDEIRKLLSDNVRWSNDLGGIKLAKEKLAAEDPFAALDELSNLEGDFPLSDEALGLIDLAQALELDPSLDFSEDFLNDLAFTPDDIDLGGIGTTGSGSAGRPNRPSGGNNNSGSNNPPSGSGSSAVLQTFYRLSKLTDADNLYTTDLGREVRPGADRITGKTGYENKGSEGRIYNRNPGSNVIPFYRYYSARDTDHYYTTNGNFSSGNVRANYQLQMTAGFIGVWDATSRRCKAGTKPLYGIYNPTSKINYYSTSKSEINIRVANGFKNERVFGCVW
jgi:hypothetical protein